MPKAFFDTNILVYRIDDRDPARQLAARTLVAEAAARDEAVISTQILQEFYVVTTTKLRIDVAAAKAIMRTLQNMEVVTVDAELINEAADVSAQHQLSFWDALVLVSAESAKCGTLYTEDLNDGQVIRDVRISNPFPGPRKRQPRQNVGLEQSCTAL